MLSQAPVRSRDFRPVSARISTMNAQGAPSPNRPRETAMRDPKTRLAVDWGHLALLLVICAVVVAYLLDARATSLKVNNLLLVQPAAILALILAALVLPQCFRR